MSWATILNWLWSMSLQLLFLGASLQGGRSNLSDRCKFLQCPAEPLCQPGETRVIVEGECCPVCQSSCSAVVCPNLSPLCRTGESLQVPEGECCPVCQSSCSAVVCPNLQPLCRIGESLQVLEGECCPQCLPDPAWVWCQFTPSDTFHVYWDLHYKLNYGRIYWNISTFRGVLCVILI